MHQDKDPKISIVVASLDSVHTIQCCIDSFKAQQYPQKELIIIDGGSIDGTVEILESNNDQIAYWESKSDRGIPHAWNKGIGFCSGYWILFLGADDTLYDSHVLKKFVKKQKYIHQSKQLIYGKVEMVDSDLIYGTVGWPWKSIYKIFTETENKIPHQGVFFRKGLFEKFGKYDESLIIASDYEFLLRCVNNGIEPQFIEDLLVTKMQKGGISNSPSSTIITYLEFARSRKKNNFSVVSIHYLWLLFKGCVKYIVSLGAKLLRNLKLMR